MRSHLDRERVEPAHGAVEGDRPEHDDAGHGGSDDLRPLGRRRVMGLESEPDLPRLEAAAGEIDVRDPPADEVRRDVDVVVDRAADERASPFARCRMAVAVHAHGITSPLAPSARGWCARWSRPRKAFAQALVPARALSFTTTGPSSIVSSSPYAFSRS